MVMATAVKPVKCASLMLGRQACAAACASLRLCGASNTFVAASPSVSELKEVVHTHVRFSYKHLKHKRHSSREFARRSYFFFLVMRDCNDRRTAV